MSIESRTITLTLPQLQLVIEALDDSFKHVIKRAERAGRRSRKLSEQIANHQALLQTLMMIKNNKDANVLETPTC